MTLEQTKEEHHTRRVKDVHHKNEGHSTRSFHHHSASSSQHRSTDHEDREAKRRARRNDDSITAPGALAFKGEHSSRAKHAKDASTVASKGEHSTHEKHSKSGHHHRHGDDKKKQRHPNRPSAPGAVASYEKEDVHIGAKKHHYRKHADRPGAKAAGASDYRSRQESRIEHKSKVAAELNAEATAATAENDQMPVVSEEGDERAVVAEMVEDDEERFQKYREQRERELNEQASNNEGSSPRIEENKNSKVSSDNGRKRNTLIFCMCCCLILVIGGSTVGGLYAAGLLSFEEEGHGPPDTVLNATDHPTEAPEVVETPDAPKADSPSSAPTFFVYDPISPDQCAAIANGDEVAGQDDMVEKSFALVVDSQLSFETEAPILLETVHQKVQEVLAPKMAGCDDAVSRRRSLNVEVHDEYKYIIGNLIVTRVVETGEDCSAASAGTICIGMRVEITIYVRGNDLSTFDYIGRLSTALNGKTGDWAIELDLNHPFQKVLLVKLVTLDPTTAPTIAPTPLASEGPSTNPTLSPTLATPSPTFMPLSFPTSEKPTGSPTPSPTVTTPSPTQAPTTPAPTVAPSSKPSLRPSIQPAAGATPIPTSLPSTLPTDRRSETPTRTNSESPSVEPSKAPSRPPSSQPSFRPSQSPSKSPTPPTREERIDAALTAAGYDSGNRNSAAYTWLTQTDTWEHATSTADFHWVDRYVLKILYQECGGASWNNQNNWLSTTVDHCDWEHTVCDDDGKITELGLRFADDITAPLPMELVSLDGLETLEFQDDTIAENGMLPPAITQLSKLTSLMILQGGLTTIGPEVESMTSMKSFFLAYSGIQSPLPQEFFQLALLEEFNCHRCFGFGGTLQTEWGSFPYLKRLEFNFASLGGTIPSEIGNLSQLTMLKLFNNYNLGGSIPPLPGSLTTCSLDGNSFTNVDNSGICTI